MKRREQDRKLAHTVPLLDPPEAPNEESLEAVRESDMFFATGEPGRFGNAVDLINAALKASEI